MFATGSAGLIDHKGDMDCQGDPSFEAALRAVRRTASRRAVGPDLMPASALKDARYAEDVARHIARKLRWGGWTWETCKPVWHEERAKWQGVPGARSAAALRTVNAYLAPAVWREVDARVVGGRPGASVGQVEDALRERLRERGQRSAILKLDFAKAFTRARWRPAVDEAERLGAPGWCVKALRDFYEAQKPRWGGALIEGLCVGPPLFAALLHRYVLPSLNEASFLRAWVDDVLAVYPSHESATKALRDLREVISALPIGLVPNEEKTKVLYAEEPFRFLGRQWNAPRLSGEGIAAESSHAATR